MDAARRKIATPLRKEREKARLKREAGIAEVLEAAGAKIKDRCWRIEWILETSVGGLIVIPYETWIACQFQDPSAAAEILYKDHVSRIHPTNGKWNFHDSYPHRTEAEHVQIVIDELRRYKLIQGGVSDGTTAKQPARTDDSDHSDNRSSPCPLHV